MKFKYSIENFRGIAIIFVMLSHFQSLQAAGDNGLTLHFLFGDATAWFVFISGYLFGHIESDQFNAKTYLFKKLKYVILPYFLLSALAIIIGIYYARPELYGLTIFKYIIWSLITGGQIATPMWFIPMIAILFLMSLFFYRIKNSWSIYVIAVIFLVLSLFSGRPYANLNPMLSALHFLGFYLLGLISSIAADKINKMPIGVSICMIIFGLFLFLLAVLFHREPMTDISFFSNIGSLNTIQLGKLGLLISVFFMFEKFFNSPVNILTYLAKVSFGLFFIHGFFMAIFGKLAQYIDFQNIFTKFLFEFFIVILMSILLTKIIKDVFREKSRYVIGC